MYSSRELREVSAGHSPRRFAAGDYRVVIADLDGAGLGEVAGELQATGAECLSIAGNLEQDDYLRQLVSDTVQRFGRMDAVIHNAAWRTLDTMRQISREDWEKTFRICVTAPAFLSRYAAVVMEENGTPG